MVCSWIKGGRVLKTNQALFSLSKRFYCAQPATIQTIFGQNVPTNSIFLGSFPARSVVNVSSLHFDEAVCARMWRFAHNSGIFNGGGNFDCRRIKSESHFIVQILAMGFELGAEGFELVRSDHMRL